MQGKSVVSLASCHLSKPLQLV